MPLHSASSCYSHHTVYIYTAVSPSVPLHLPSSFFSVAKRSIKMSLHSASFCYSCLFILYSLALYAPLLFLYSDAPLFSHFILLLSFVVLFLFLRCYALFPIPSFTATIFSSSFLHLQFFPIFPSLLQFFLFLPSLLQIFLLLPLLTTFPQSFLHLQFFPNLHCYNFFLFLHCHAHFLFLQWYTLFFSLLHSFSICSFLHFLVFAHFISSPSVTPSLSKHHELKPGPPFHPHRPNG